MNGRWFAILALAGLLTAGCVHGSSGGGGSSGAGRVDPQTLQDVIDATYMVPGPEVRRGMRVLAFRWGIAIKECGGKPFPIDETSDRFSQDLFPDLELIRERGFVEEDDRHDDSLEGLRPNCNLIPDSIESYQAWKNLGAEWQIVAETVVQESAALESTKKPMAQCLRRRTGLKVDDNDPTTFLHSVNTEAFNEGWKADEKRWATAYADCGKAYFDTLGSELKKERKPLVERNRELLERFAVDIADAGYAP